MLNDFVVAEATTPEAPETTTTTPEPEPTTTCPAGAMATTTTKARIDEQANVSENVSVQFRITVTKNTIIIRAAIY